MSIDTLHGRLRKARIRAGYRSAAEAARAHGWPVPTYSGRENGNRAFDAEVAKVYGAAFSVDPSWLLLGDGDAPTGEPRPEGAAVLLHQLPNGKARLQINKVVDMPLALKVLTMLEGGE